LQLLKPGTLSLSAADPGIKEIGGWMASVEHEPITVNGGLGYGGTASNGSGKIAFFSVVCNLCKP